MNLTQRDFAKRIEMDESQLSKYLTGKWPTPVDQAPKWCAALDLVAEHADELTLAIHLSNATPYVAQVVDRLLRETHEARSLIGLYEDRTSIILGLLEDLQAMSSRAKG